jgi:hypothetical protein
MFKEGSFQGFDRLNRNDIIKQRKARTTEINLEVLYFVRR